MVGNAELLEKAKNDPVFYVEHILGLRLYDYQKDALRQLSTNSFTICSLVRWSGRTHIKKIMQNYRLLKASYVEL